MIMGTLSPGKRRGSDGWSGRVRAIPRLCLDLHALVAKQLEAGTPMNPATPVMPEEQNRRPLAATARSSGATLPSPRHSIGTARAGDRNDNYGYWPHRPRAGYHRLPCAVRVRDPFLIGRTAQRAIGLEGEVLPRKTANFEGGGNRGLAIATGTGRLLFGLGHRRSKLGDEQGFRGQLVPQFQAEVPHPLRDHLPALLLPGRVAAPTIGIDLPIPIGERRRVMPRDADTAQRRQQQ